MADDPAVPPADSAPALSAAPPPASDVAFSDAVKAQQTRLGSRRVFERPERAAWRTRLTDDLVQFLAAIDTFFFATASAAGQPYVQHRGGPPGFLRALDAGTLAFADFGGNRQYITVGNLSENPRAHLFVPHFATRQRVKFWGRARFVEGDAGMLAEVAVAGHPARVERAIVFEIDAWDINCPSHIVPRFTEAEIAPAVDKLAARIRELEAEIARLKGEAPPDPA